VEVIFKMPNKIRHSRINTVMIRLHITCLLLLVLCITLAYWPLYFPLFCQVVLETPSDDEQHPMPLLPASLRDEQQQQHSSASHLISSSSARAIIMPLKERDRETVQLDPLPSVT
jgi:hypothetical protein